MRVAALDLGTNTFLCLIADVSDGQVKSVISDQVWLVRLGQDVHRTKRFHPDALARAATALSEAEQAMRKFAAERILAVATSAARDVANQEKLVEICNGLKIPLKIISGPLEAELTYAGATQGRACGEGCAVIDVGGGSTEIIVQTLAKPSTLTFQSLDIGSVRLTEMFFTGYPIAPEELTRARKYIQDQLAQVHFDPAQVRTVIAVAGTPTTLAAIDLGISFVSEKIDQLILQRERLEYWLETMAKLHPSEIVSHYKIEEKRADVIVAGTLILFEALKHLNAKQMVVSTRGVRYGVATALERGLL